MTKLYLAGPMFCDAELAYNLRLKELMAAEGYELLLPQEQPLAISPEKMSDPEYRDAATMMVFEADTRHIRECDALVLVMDGRVPDEGACVELGYAYAMGKECFGLKTDKRVSEMGTDNLMIGGAVKLRVQGSVEELVTELRRAGLRPHPPAAARSDKGLTFRKGLHVVRYDIYYREN